MSYWLNMSWVFEKPFPTAIHWRVSTMFFCLLLKCYFGSICIITAFADNSCVLYHYLHIITKVCKCSFVVQIVFLILTKLSLLLHFLLRWDKNIHDHCMPFLQLMVYMFAFLLDRNFPTLLPFSWDSAHPTGEHLKLFTSHNDFHLWFMILYPWHVLKQL